MPSSSKKTLVMGASDNPARYSFLAVNSLRAHGHPVVAIGKKNVIVNDVPVLTEIIPIPDLDTVTLYLNAGNQKTYYDFIVELHPKRVIFNPGSENEEFKKILQGHRISVMEACTLVLLSTGQF
jgi:uncharacterized protein